MIPTQKIASSLGKVTDFGAVSIYYPINFFSNKVKRIDSTSKAAGKASNTGFSYCFAAQLYLISNQPTT